MACNLGLQSAHESISVIDVNSRETCSLNHGVRFVALSYVWGDQEEFVSSRDGSRNCLLSKDCLTVEDAIVVTKKLGIPVGRSIFHRTEYARDLGTS